MSNTKRPARTDSQSGQENEGTSHPDPLGTLAERGSQNLGGGLCLSILRTGTILNGANDTLSDYNPDGWAGGGGDHNIMLIDAAYNSVLNNWEAKRYYSNDMIIDGSPYAIVPLYGITGSTEPDINATWFEDNAFTEEFAIQWSSAVLVNWASTTFFTKGKCIFEDGSYWDCIGAGTSGGEEPDWTSAPNPGDIITDGVQVAWIRCPGDGTWSANTELYAIAVLDENWGAYVAYHKLFSGGNLYNGIPLGRYFDSSVEPDFQNLAGNELIFDDNPKFCWAYQEPDTYALNPSIISMNANNGIEDGRILTVHVTGGGPINGEPCPLYMGLLGAKHFSSITVYSTLQRPPMDGSKMFEYFQILAGGSASFVYDGQREIWHLIGTANPG